MNTDNINQLIGDIIKAHSKPVVCENKNGKQCTNTKICYQTLACQAGGKKLCKYRKLDEQK